MIAVAIAAGVLLASTAAAQEPAPGIRYAADQLDCATFRETARTRVETHLGGQVRRESVTLDGVWRIRAGPGARDRIALEAWYDSLALVRASEEGERKPDTDGLVGGRFRGTLDARGAYQPEARPFVPDEVAEVADVSRALEDLFPVLPPRPLGPGEAWSDASGLEIRRLGDSVAASRLVPGTGVAPGDTLLRFHLILERTVRQAPVRGDTAPIPVRQTTREEGDYVWHPRVGLLRRDRSVEVETEIPIAGRVRQPVRSRIEQRIVLERLERRCPSGGASSPVPGQS